MLQRCKAASILFCMYTDCLLMSKIRRLYCRQLLNFGARHITATYEFLSQTCGYPFRILYITLTAGKLLDGVRIDKIQFEVVFQNTPNRHQ